MNHFLYSLISFIIALFFILVGVVCFMLPWSAEVRTELVQFILEDSYILLLFGLTLIIIGLAIVVNIILSGKKKYYYIRSRNNVALLDENLFKNYLDNYWKQLFPNHEIPHRLVLKKNKLHVYADLPYVPLEQQKTLLTRIQTDLDDIFSKYFGYLQEYKMSISFASE